MVRGSFVDKNGIRKGIWTQEEDHLLRSYVHKYGHSNWSLLPKFAGLSRCGKSCRLRWMNYLRPGLKRGNYSEQEEELIIQLHKQFGNKWSIIATKLPARTDNEIKNYWHTNLKKKKKKKQRDECESSSQLEEKYSSGNQKRVAIDDRGRDEKANRNIIQSPTILESSSLLISKTSNSSCEDSNLSCDSSISNSNWTTSFQTLQDSCELDFWSQPFVHEQDHAFKLPMGVEDTIMSPYFPNYEDSVDLFYQVMQDFPPN